MPPTNGPDTLFGTSAANTIDALAGNDFIYGLAGNDYLIGGYGTDVIYGGNDNDVLVASIRFDYDGGSDLQRNYLEGGNGRDRLYGGDGSDVLSGGAGNDSIFGNGGNDSISGGSGSDYVYYSYAPGSVRIYLSAGLVYGADGNDTLSSIENAVGSNYADQIYGNSANNVLAGLNGGDAINGGSGNDTLNGGRGRDTLSGGTGTDTFQFLSSSDTGNYYQNQADRITDHADGERIILPSGLSYSGSPTSFPDIGEYTVTTLSGGDYLVTWRTSSGWHDIQVNGDNPLDDIVVASPGGPGGPGDLELALIL